MADFFDEIAPVNKFSEPAMSKRDLAVGRVYNQLMGDKGFGADDARAANHLRSLSPAEQANWEAIAMGSPNATYPNAQRTSVADPAASQRASLAAHPAISGAAAKALPEITHSDLGDAYAKLGKLYGWDTRAFGDPAGEVHVGYSQDGAPAAALTRRFGNGGVDLHRGELAPEQRGQGIWKDLTHNELDMLRDVAPGAPVAVGPGNPIVEPTALRRLNATVHPDRSVSGTVPADPQENEEKVPEAVNAGVSDAPAPILDLGELRPLTEEDPFSPFMKGTASE